MNLVEEKCVKDLANLLHNFLPGSGNSVVSRSCGRHFKMASRYTRAEVEHSALDLFDGDRERLHHWMTHPNAMFHHRVPGNVLKTDPDAVMAFVDELWKRKGFRDHLESLIDLQLYGDQSE